jgi:hypothetical protein
VSEKITLKSSHIYLEGKIVRNFFEGANAAFAVYNKEQNSILITPVTSAWFKKMYNPAQYILKARNLKGDKTLAIGDIFIDNDLDETDRELEVEFIEKTKLIKVKM